MSWSSRNLIMITMRSGSRMDNTRSRTKPMVRTASATRGTSAAIGLSGSLGRTPRTSMPASLTPRTAFGRANTFLFSVRLPLLPFIPSLNDIQDWSNVGQSASSVVHADRAYGQQRRVPQLLARGPFNSWGYDKGISAEMTQTGDSQWELEIMSTWPSIVQLNVFGYDDFYYGDVDGDGV